MEDRRYPVSDGAVHSELGASSYKRWKACPGSVRLSRGIEKKSSVYADEGTHAHELAETWLKWLADLKNLGKMLPGIEDVDAEMRDAVLVYVAHIRDLRVLRPTFEWIEAKLNLAKHHPKLFGTGDYVCYFKETKTLHVVDYKHGAGVAVDIVEDGIGNVQLLYYAAAALSKANVPIKKVVVTIVQPRCPHPDGPIRSWECDSTFMLDFLADLVEDAKATEAADAPLNAGSHCRWCPAVGICPAIKNRAVVEAQKVFAPTQSYDPQALAETLGKLDQIEGWAHGVREFAYREAEAGREIPGYKLVDKRPTRKWAPDLRVHDLAVALEKDESKFYDEPKIMSPAQIEKACGLNKDQKAVLERFTVKESSGKKLVPINDDRAPAPPQIRNVFEVITKEETNG